MLKLHYFFKVYRYFKLCLLFLLSFILSALVLNQAIPTEPVPSNLAFVSFKYNNYFKNKDKYDTLFIGSSRICNQVIPQEFDRTTKFLGKATNSYNFGIPAMRALPSYFLLKELLATQPKNLKWVFIETDLDSFYEPIENARNNRSIYWHNKENTLFALDRIIDDDSESFTKKIALVGSHLIPFVYNQINVGRLFNSTISQPFSHPQEEIAKDYIFANNGYYPLDLQTEDPHRIALLENTKAYTQKVNLLAKKRKKEKLPSASKLELLTLIVDEVEAAGANPVFIIPPRMELKSELVFAYKEGYIPALLAFNDPNKYPDLYQLDLRHDLNHLNHQGSQKFSRLIAEKFVKNLNI